MRWRTRCGWSGVIASVVLGGCSTERQASRQPATVASVGVADPSSRVSRATSMSASVPATAAAPQSATASAGEKEAERQLAGLLEEDWEAYLRDEPTFASMQGDTRYGRLWED